jgi:hypothetical protein
MTTHDLKIWPEWFDSVITRKMEFAVRKNDRNFQPGDVTRNHEYDPQSMTYTGRVAVCRVTSVFSNIPGILPGYVAMGSFFLHLEAGHAQKQEASPL